jgi:hypothetical protein
MNANMRMVFIELPRVKINKGNAFTGSLSVGLPPALRLAGIDGYSVGAMGVLDIAQFATRVTCETEHRVLGMAAVMVAAPERCG